MTDPSTSRKPTHRLYTVKGDDKNARWVDIGAAWLSRDARAALRIDLNTPLQFFALTPR